MDLTKTHAIDMDSWYRIRLLIQTWTHAIDMDSLFKHGLMVQIWYWQRLMVWTQTYGIDNTHGIDLNSRYSIGTPVSHTYERAESFPCAGFFSSRLKKISKRRSLLFAGRLQFWLATSSCRGIRNDCLCNFSRHLSTQIRYPEFPRQLKLNHPRVTWNSTYSFQAFFKPINKVINLTAWCRQTF